MFRDLNKKQRAGLVLLVVLVLGGIGWEFMSFPAHALKQPVEVTVNNGDTGQQVADTLKKAGVIRSESFFLFYLRLRGWSDTLEAGDYLIPAGVSMEEITRLIVNGITHNDVTVVIPEGYNIWQIDGRLADSGLVTRGQFAAAYYTREGHLFPDTYRFRRGSTMAELDKKMEDNFNVRNVVLLGPLSLPARDRIITIASIIEKESLRGVDMQLVAGVIENRVKRGMTLSIDATVDYGSCLRKFLDSVSAGQPTDCAVNLEPVGKEIHIDGPYNSYTRKGYPPGAISNPGKEALDAVLSPKGDYLYYLSTRDGRQMIFSKTGAEQEANRRRYLGL